MKKGKLLIVTTVAQTLRAFLLPYARHFRELGWRVDGMANGALECPECKIAFDSVWQAPFSRNVADPRNLTIAAHEVRKIVEREGYDIVHVHTPVAAFATRFALRHRRAVSLIYTAHGFHFHPEGRIASNLVFAGLEKLAARWVDHLVVINQEDELAARWLGLVPSDRLVRMPGIGVETKAQRPSASETGAIRRELGLGPDDTLITMVAEFTSNKRHADVLRALSRLSDPHVHLALAGSGPLESATEGLASSLGIAGRVHFLGFRKDVPALLAASAFSVLASQREGLPRVALESLALGVPMVGTRIRGIAELVGNDAGRLVPVGDVARLASAMKAMCESPESRREMSKAARRRSADYDIERVMVMHEALYARALEDLERRDG